MSGSIRAPLPCAFGLALATLAAWPLAAQSVPDARALGVPLTGTPGRYNAITDVAGVEVGHTTIIRGDGVLRGGTGPCANWRHRHPAPGPGGG